MVGADGLVHIFTDRPPEAGFIALAVKLGLKAPTLPQNWLSLSDVRNLLHLAAVTGTHAYRDAMLAYADVFRFLGILFVVMFPLIFLMKKPQKRGGLPMAH